MPDIDRRLLIAVPIAAIVLILIGFGIGRLTAGDASSDATVVELADSTTTTAVDGATTTTEAAAGAETDTTIIGDPSAALPPESDLPPGGIPVYGTDEDREQMVLGLVEAGVTGGTREGVLATADHVCYNLERLEAQGRSAAYATRVVWNESLLELDSQDLAAFGAVFSAAPFYVCPDSIEYGAEVAYWLGY